MGQRKNRDKESRSGSGSGNWELGIGKMLGKREKGREGGLGEIGLWGKVRKIERMVSKC